jgi:thioesterase domain-containing protein
LLAAPTVVGLAVIIGGDGWASAATSLVPIQPHGAKVPFYCAHLAFGHVFYYRDLVKALGPDQPCYAFQAVGLDGRAERHRRIEDMAAHYIAEMRAHRPRGPYLIGGASFGGLVAYEMAQQLLRAGEEPGLVALFDTPSPLAPPPPTGARRLLRAVSHVARRIEHHAGSLWMLGPERWPAYLRSKADNAAVELREALGERALPEGVIATKKTIQDTLARYVPSPYPGRITLFRASKRPLGVSFEPTLGWGALVKGGVEIHEVPGYHGAIISEPRVSCLVEPLRGCLARASASGRSRLDETTHRDCGRG